MKNIRKSLVQVKVCLRKIQKSLSCNFPVVFHVFKISRPLRDVKFTINLAHGDKLIGRFYDILHGFSNKDLCPPLESVLPKSISDKRAAKKRKSLAKIVFLDVGTTVAIPEICV